MPKQAQKINRFEGGLINYFDKRDLPENALANATNIMVDVMGKVRQMGQEQPFTIGTVNAQITPGYGLFAFSADYNISGVSGEFDLLAIQNTNQINIYDNEEHVGQILLGDDQENVRPVFYYIDNSLIVMDGNFANVNNVGKQFGYYGQKTWFASQSSSIKTQFPNDKWLSCDLKMREAPTADSVDGSDPAKVPQEILD